ncbi:unnamed protein product, partial [marine sediment metagenome]
VKKTLMKEGKDYVIDGNRQYTARSGFAKLHQGFFLSDGKPEVKTLYYDKPQEFEYTHRIRRELKKEKITTKIYGFEAYVTVINVNTGRHASGEGACTLEELHQTNNMSPKWYHRCLGTAKTRAWNRAVSNYVGSAEVSAEEMGLVYETEEPKRKAVESEQTPVKKPSDPDRVQEIKEQALRDREKPPEEEPVDEPEPEEEEPEQKPPRSVAEVAKLISDEIPGSYELVIVSDRGGYWRIGKKTKLDEEIVY